MKKLAVLLLTLSACSSAPTKTAPAGDALFPPGNYRHSVRLHIPTDDHGGERSFHFDGVVNLKPGEIHVVGLSPFGTTLFRIDENRASGQVDVHIDFDALKPREPKLREYYGVLRLLLIARRKDAAGSTQDGLTYVKVDSEGRPLEATAAGAPDTRFVFERYDERGIPVQMTIQGPKFKVELEVPGYEI